MKFFGLIILAVLVILSESKQRSRLVQTSVGPNPSTSTTQQPQPYPNNQTISNSNINNTAGKNSSIQPPKPPQSMGTVLTKYGAFCGLKSRRCVGFCQKPTGEIMDDDYNNFFCYVSTSIAGDYMPCTHDYQCQDDYKGQRAQGAYCAKEYLCKVSNIRKM